MVRRYLTEVGDPDAVEQRLREAGWLPTSEAALLMNNVSYKYLYYLGNLGKISFKKVGGSRWYHRDIIEKYVADHPQVGTRRAARYDV